MKKHPVSAMNRRSFVASAAALSSLALAGRSYGQDAYPSRPVRIVVPFAAGGNIDIQGRMCAQRLSETIGGQFVVENRVGGNGIIAAEQIARSAPDGYNLLWASTSVIAIVPAAATKKVSYDPVKDFVPICGFSAGPQVLLLNADVPAKTLQEFVVWVKAQKSQVTYAGGGGPASASNLIMALFLARTGLDMLNVSYRGTAPALTDVMAGHVPCMFIPVSEATAQASNSKLRMLAVTGSARSHSLPNVPTVAESGYPGFNAASWTGLMGPANLPKEIIAKLSTEMVKAGKDPKFIEQLTAQGVDSIAEGPEKFAQFIASEMPLWADAVKRAGVTL
ncbi:MAG: tripartite tricarboxylate transporter substrate binding protein [Pseudomonadota bacterium]